MVHTVALLAGQQFDSQVAGSSPDWWPWASYLHLCAFVVKQYNLVLAKRSDLFGWESNCSAGGK